VCRWDCSRRFYEQSASRQVDVIGSAHQFPLKFAIRKLSEIEIRCHTDFDPARVFLRDVDVNAQLPRLSDGNKSVFTALLLPELMRSPIIRIACGDHAIEKVRRPFERDQRRVLLYGRLIGFNDSVIGVVGADGVIDVLLGNSVAFQKSLIPTDDQKGLQA